MHLSISLCNCASRELAVELRLVDDAFSFAVWRSISFFARRRLSSDFRSSARCPSSSFSRAAIVARIYRSGIENQRRT